MNKDFALNPARNEAPFFTDIFYAYGVEIEFLLVGCGVVPFFRKHPLGQNTYQERSTEVLEPAGFFSAGIGGFADAQLEIHGVDEESSPECTERQGGEENNQLFFADDAPQRG